MGHPGGASAGGASAGGASAGWADVGDALIRALSDPDPSVVEAACYALGELGAADVSGRGESGLAVEERGAPAGEVLEVRAGEVVGPLATVATSHPEALCREAAVAALGALGHPDGLRAVLAAMGDKPALRRRAAVALAAFEAPEAELALERAAQDRDWQVRQVAEDLLGRRSERS
jgi:HEAT repeat protein